MVVKGYFQKFEVDFDQTFTAMVKNMAFQVLFAISAYYNLVIDQINIKTVFLYCFIDQLIYVTILKKIEIEAKNNMVYRLLKAFYGLKQFLQLWYERLLSFFLEKLGLACIHANHNIFIKETSINSLIVSMFIDNIKVMTLKSSGIIY